MAFQDIQGVQGWGTIVGKARHSQQQGGDMCVYPSCAGVHCILPAGLTSRGRVLRDTLVACRRTYRRVCPHSSAVMSKGC